MARISLSVLTLLLTLTAPAAAQRYYRHYVPYRAYYYPPVYYSPAQPAASSASYGAAPQPAGAARPSYYTQDYAGGIVATQDGDGQTGSIRVRLPAGAELWIDKTKSAQQGAIREFVTPGLDPERVYIYPLRARWVEDGITVEKSIKVKVFAGSRVTVNFVRPPAPRPPASMPAAPAPIVPERPVRWTAPDSFRVGN
jgi:uncharacterized protein (TIGR03000 family)